ncbi:ABC transporter permease [Roseinatronobacter sp. NSM]|uniref:ABC transporter permease n=1 Tax=Roseinatronobacter sp. NSM TaxID=3457785 RepID=UPI004036F73A
MYSSPGRSSIWAQFFTTLTLIFNQGVRNVRKSHGNAIIGLLLNITQTLILVAVFMVIFLFAGMRAGAVRGDILLYLMTGVFMFMAHVKVIGAVAGAEGPASAMMKHRPMNPIVAIGGAALGELYIQVVTVVVLLFLYHALWTPLTIYQPIQTFAVFLSVWFAGLAIGIVMYAIKPWAPSASKLITMFYTRLNMVASGKFFLANTLPESVLPYFMWNPLFHAIDQARGYAFINYNPMHTWVYYPLVFGGCALVLGLMGEFYTRSRVSMSWSAKH